MSVKEKVLAALDCAIDDVSEDRLVDILLDAYKLKQKRIEELNGENAREREKIYQERELLSRERERMRTDPTYWVMGDYFFECRERYFAVRIQGPKVDMYERAGIGPTNSYDYAARHMTPELWGRK